MMNIIEGIGVFVMYGLAWLSISIGITFILAFSGKLLNNLCTDHDYVCTPGPVCFWMAKQVGCTACRAAPRRLPSPRAAVAPWRDSEAFFYLSPVTGTGINRDIPMPVSQTRIRAGS